ncbi:superfamily I DNA and/or RNA helicase [Pullulanibacillus pueri]|nr:AAA domain-containing protein [Pullulanibacillus pueri]MBM7679874.1 superfamily I DNA and/or RNA helicase [Pullulanibacillus pueri]
MIILKDRLNDLSRRNRSIRMLKSYDKWSFDLSRLQKVGKEPEDILKEILGRDKKISIVKQDIRDEESLILSQKLTNLFRNIKAIEDETGLYDLFIGFPFISGAMMDGTYVRAPLFLYPVKLEKVKGHGTEWEIHVDEESEPQLNRTLFLALKKMSDLNVPESIFDEAVEKASTGNIPDYIEWLKSYSINVDWEGKQNIELFKNYTKDTIPSFDKGEFQIDNNALLGHFAQGNSALLKDYEDFIDQLEEGETDLGILQPLLGLGDITESYEVDNLAPSISESETQKAKEKDRFFVLDTDASQEEIINSVDKTDGLVIHGPPGTGKSQVIVNIIANAMAQNKKILLVCQKRAALDVVYQRLDALGLSANIGLLHDEKNDRKRLYRKLHTRLTVDTFHEDLEQEFEDLSRKIENREAKLDAIAKGLYEVQPYGYRAFDLYGLGKPLSEQEVTLNLSSVLRALNKSNLDEVLMKIFSYGGYYSRFGQEDYPLKDRNSFAKLEIKDRLNIIEILKKAIDKAEESIAYLDHFERDEEITPEYSWGVNDKLSKIYDDLNPEEKKTLQKLRLWWWTSFTGKSIVQELIHGDKFKGLDSKEWPKLRESLKILYELSNVSEEMTKEIQSLSSYFSKVLLDKYKEQVSKGDIPLQALKQQHEYVIQDFEDLRNMDRIYEESLPFIQSIIKELKGKEELNEQYDLSEKWVDAVKQSTFVHWIDEIENSYPELRQVGTEEFNKLRSSFKELIEKKKNLSAKVLQNRMIKALNETQLQHQNAFKDIIHQTGKKRQVWPVRKLVKKYSLEGLLDVMPVWLVSPETASAIFPLEKDLFDLVIFDEASQCTVENGMPSIYRGSKVIVAGDEKQLPPSNLFKSGMHEDDEDEELDEIEESESLLNLTKRVFPSKLLQWHYRSKSEELINFSNHAYYNGNVQIAPNVDHLKDPACIQWHKVDGNWINQCNEVEAEAVVRLLKSLLVKDASKTIGIITFNAKQQDKIQDIIDQRTEKDKEFNTVYQQVMSRDLDERIFVKNIENVQGDERDIIIFSIAYAKNEQGRVYNRFGTLGQQGGENRLNVAVTRAKEEIHLVSSIEPHELNVSNVKNDGPKFLRSYMEYAEAVSNLQKDTIESVLVNLNEEMNTKRQQGNLDFDSPFEEQVYKHLTDIGYKVDTQVGMSGYRIDQAIVHPDHPERYILGIECDGAMYHSAPSAKERDVYRQRFLESKGWKITRIWSRNWWKDPVGEIEKIDQLVKKLVEEEKIKEALKLGLN